LHKLPSINLLVVGYLYFSILHHRIKSNCSSGVLQMAT